MAIKAADLDLVKWLKEVCNADFSLRNRRGESAVQIAVVWSKRNPSMQYLSIIKYLVEVVGIPIIDDYEDILLVCQSRKIVDYIVKRLLKFNVKVSKKDIEDKY